MSKIDIKKEVMEKIKKDEIVMKPKAYFVIGSVITLIGLIASVISSVFLVSIISFLLRSHGPMGEYRFSLMIQSFPWWMPIIAIISLVLGALFIRKYDLSYKFNLGLLILGFILAVLIAGFVIDITGLNNVWLKRGPMNSVMRNYLEQNNSDYGNGNHRNYMNGPRDGSGNRFRNWE